MDSCDYDDHLRRCKSKLNGTTFYLCHLSQPCTRWADEARRILSIARRSSKLSTLSGDLRSSLYRRFLHNFKRGTKCFQLKDNVLFSAVCAVFGLAVAKA